MNRPPMVVQSTPPQTSLASRLGRSVSAALGALGLLLSAPCVVAVMTQLAAVPTDSVDFALLMLLGTFSAMMSLFSLLMLYSVVKRPKAQPFLVDHAVEQQVLGAAERQRGVLTLATLAMNSSMSTEQAQLALDMMVSRGVATTGFDEDGLMLYRFAGLARGSSRGEAIKSVTQLDFEAFDRDLESGATSLDFSEREEPAQSAPSSLKKHR